MHKLFVITILGAAIAVAQTPDPKTASGYAAMLQGTLRKNIVKSAEKMPEENYSFKPVPEVRSFGELLGHVANAEYNICSAAMAEKSPNTVNIEKTKTSKADLIAALNGAFDYCEKIYAGMTDAKIAEMGKQGTSERNRLGILNYNNAHTNEHYGNLVTYMRLKGIVPPSSER